MTKIQQEMGFRFTGPDYCDLFKRSDATSFQHPVWLERLYDTLVPAVGAEPLVITGRDEGSGKLQFVLPLVRRASRHVRRVEFADLGVSDYAAPVIVGAVEDVFTDPGTYEAVHKALGRTDLACIDKVPGEPALMSTVLGSQSVRTHDYETHAITLDGTFESWRERLEPRFVRHLNDKRKRLRAAGRVVDVREVDSTGEVDAAFARMREFRRARFADRQAIDLVQDERYYAFYREVARHGAAHGGPGSTTVLTVNDDIVAASFCLKDAERDAFLLIGYDIERFRNYALGLLLVEDLIAASFADGKRVHDLTLGHDDYKKSFGAEATPMYSVRLPMTARGRAAQFGADQNARARRLAKRALSFQERRFPQLDLENRIRRLLVSRP